MEARQNPVSPLQTALWFGLPRTVAELGKPREHPNQSPSRRKSLTALKLQDLRRPRLGRRPDLASLWRAVVYMGYWMQGKLCTGGMLKLMCVPFSAPSLPQVIWRQCANLCLLPHSHPAVAPSLVLTQKCSHPPLLALPPRSPARRLY